MKTLKEQKWMILVYAAILFTIGVVQFVLSIVEFSSAMHILSYAVAVGLFVIGAMHILTNLIVDTKSYFNASLVLGSIAIACGVVFVVIPYILGVFIVYLVPSLLIVFGSLLLAKAIIGIVFKYKASWIFSYFLGAAIGITLGILAFVYLNKSLTVSQIIYCIIAVVIVAVGVFLFVFGVKRLNKKSESEK